MNPSPQPDLNSPLAWKRFPFPNGTFIDWNHFIIGCHRNIRMTCFCFFVFHFNFRPQQNTMNHKCKGKKLVPFTIESLYLLFNICHINMPINKLISGILSSIQQWDCCHFSFNFVLKLFEMWLFCPFLYISDPMKRTTLIKFVAYENYCDWPHDAYSTLSWKRIFRKATATIILSKILNIKAASWCASYRIMMRYHIA